MRKTVLMTAGLLLTVTVLGGCGSSKNASGAGSYCTILKSAKTEIAAFSGSSVPNTKAFSAFLGDVKSLSAQAPAKVSADWKTVDTALKGLTDALASAGVTLQDLVSALATGKLPAGVTAADITALSTKVQALTSADFNTATAAIEKNAKDECGIVLKLAR